MERIKKLLLILIPAVLLGMFFLFRPASPPEPAPQPDPAPITDPQPSAELDENGVYDTKDEVALYLYTYHHLPPNYMTKKEARKLGWDEGPLHLVEEGMCLGGDVFANREGLLSLARQLFDLAEETTGAHIHYDDSNALEEGSAPLIIERIE